MFRDQLDSVHLSGGRSDAIPCVSCVFRRSCVVGPLSCAPAFMAPELGVFFLFFVVFCYVFRMFCVVHSVLVRVNQ